MQRKNGKLRQGNTPMGCVYIIAKKKSFTIGNDSIEIFETVSVTTSPAIAESILKERSDYYFIVKAYDALSD